MTFLFSSAGMRIRAGLARLSTPAWFSPPVDLAPLERPLLVLAIFFPLSMVLMFGADAQLGLWMKSFPSHLRGVARWIADLGEGIEVMVVAGLVVILSIFVPAERWRKRAVVGASAVTVAAAFIFLSVAGGGLVDALVKNIIRRARPGLMDAHGHLYFQPVSFTANFAAFPSGHSATAGAMALALALVFPRLRSILIPIGALICLSRQAVGAHWSSDALMGWGVGVSFTFWLAHMFARRGLLFDYDRDGRLKRRRGHRVTAALVDAIRTGAVPTRPRPRPGQ